MTTERFADRIVRHLARQGYQPQKIHKLAKAMGIADEEYGDFRETVKALMKTGRIVMGSASALTLPDPARRVVGRFRSNPRGFGFVIPDTPNAHGDLFIPPGHAGDAVTGDTVAAAVLKRGKREGRMMYEGRIVEIIERGQSRFVGELCHELQRWFVRPDGDILHAPIFVGDPGAKRARSGDQVVVEISEYPARGRDARGVITKVLGKRGDPGVDAQSIIQQYQLPEEFPAAVAREAARVVKSYDPEDGASGREDLCDLTVITIDPDDARDFDDAISLTELAGGRLELGVHIADVSYFVQPGRALDEEARARANSVYFPRLVIPMLPEVLSNGVCSLQEGEPRLTKSAFITYDTAGRRVATRFANTVICSAKRLTYGQATQILAGKVGGYAKKVTALLRRMDALARVIRRRRLANGMLVLDLPEVEVVFDEKGAVAGVEPADMSFSHTIIEMFMVEANEVVAELLAGLGVPALRRVHPPPDEAATPPLNRFLRALRLPPVKGMDRAALQPLLEKVRGRPEAFAVNLAILKSLERAVYEPAPVGHFALASDNYTHFTSPIRRYPDLTIHRLLDAYLQGGFRKGRRRVEVPTLDECKKVGAHCSRNERRAEAAERELKLVYILRLLEQRVGEEFEGIVTGVTNFGIFVQLPEYLVEGLLRFTDMPEDWWEVDSAAGCVIGQRTRRQFKIGDRVRVTIAAIDLADRKLDLALAAGPAGAISQTARPPKTGRRPGSRRAEKAAPATRRRRK
ncbi:MAG TPA: ribonuclease R [Phycisphaerae bacterium]|nr:ribonuclease R [Phycisphaerae bacterium]HNU44241.1 ribonuclease R [Phycisphaerae bacterium]